MGRYFDDNLSTEDYDEYDAYLEHFGIPKIKWNPQVRAKYDQLHNKTRNMLKKAGENIANNQTIQDFRSKAKSGYKSISDGAKSFGSKASKVAKSVGNNAKIYGRAAGMMVKDTPNYYTKKRTSTEYSNNKGTFRDKVIWKTTDFHRDQANRRLKTMNAIDKGLIKAAVKNNVNKNGTIKKQTKARTFANKAINKASKVNHYFNEEVARKGTYTSKEHGNFFKNPKGYHIDSVTKITKSNTNFQNDLEKTGKKIRKGLKKVNPVRALRKRQDSKMKKKGYKKLSNGTYYKFD